MVLTAECTQKGAGVHLNPNVVVDTEVTQFAGDHYHLFYLCLKETAVADCLVQYIFKPIKEMQLM